MRPVSYDCAIRVYQLRTYCMVEAREPGAGKLPAVADAPGTYVKVDLRHQT